MGPLGDWGKFWWSHFSPLIKYWTDFFNFKNKRNGNSYSPVKMRGKISTLSAIQKLHIKLNVEIFSEFSLRVIFKFWNANDENKKNLNNEYFVGGKLTTKGETFMALLKLQNVNLPTASLCSFFFLSSNVKCIKTIFVSIQFVVHFEVVEIADVCSVGGKVEFPMLLVHTQSKVECLSLEEGVFFFKWERTEPFVAWSFSLESRSISGSLGLE